MSKSTVKSRRRKSRLSLMGRPLREISDATGISISYLYRIATGQRPTPSVRVALKIAKYLKTTLDAVYGELNRLKI